MRVLQQNNGLGCACQQMGAVADYDQVKIGGNIYSVNQILDKTITAKTDTKVYSSRPFLVDGKIQNGTILGTVKAGQPIGRVYSYVRASQAADGRVWLWIENGSGKALWVPDEAIEPKQLQSQGVKTVEQELKEEKEKEQKENDPVTYYAKKIVLPGLLVIGGIYLVAQLGKQFIASKIKN